MNQAVSSELASSLADDVHKRFDRDRHGRDGLLVEDLLHAVVQVARLLPQLSQDRLRTLGCPRVQSSTLQVRLEREDRRVRVLQLRIELPGL
jgi:hypothetical protein